MLDIVCMLFHIVRAYFPAEVRWSCLLPIFDNFAFVSCMTTVFYSIWFTLRYVVNRDALRFSNGVGFPSCVGF